MTRDSHEREEAIEALRRMAATLRRPPGREAFVRETGLSALWEGTYWAKWSDFVHEAGLTPNRFGAERIEPDRLLEVLADLTLKIGRFPTASDVKLAARQNPGFPSSNTFGKLGRRSEQLSAVRDWALRQTANPKCVRLAALLGVESAEDSERPHTEPSAVQTEDGFVYMIKLGKHYKIGKTFSVPRRHREIALELPEKPDVVHSIRTDDPSGIEAYWHGRFAPRRTNGEWFALTRDDIAAFKKRRFM